MKQEYDHKIKVDCNNYKRGIEYLKKLGYINSSYFDNSIMHLVSNGTLKYLMGNVEEKEMYYCEGGCDECPGYCKSLKIDHAFEREEKLKILLNY